MSDVPDYLDQVREVAEGYDVFGELGRKSDDDIWFLARAADATALVALRLYRHRTDGQGEPVFALEIAKELDSDVAMGEGGCIVCQASLRTFARFCSQCGADQTAGTRVAASEAQRQAMLEEVRAAASGRYEVLGEMPWVSGAGPVFFALEKASRQLVRLRVREAAGGLELGETQVAMTLSGSVTAARVTPAVARGPAPVVRLRPSAPTPTLRQGTGAKPSADRSPPLSRRERALLATVAVLGLAVLILAGLLLTS